MSMMMNTLLTGLRTDASGHLIGSLASWNGRTRSESAGLEMDKQFLQEAQLLVCDNPLEATPWKNGFVPEARGISSDHLEFRIQGSLPPLAYIVSRPRQPATAGEDLMHRFDAGVRPYWLRDCNQDLEVLARCTNTQVNGETRLKFSVAHVV